MIAIASGVLLACGGGDNAPPEGASTIGRDAPRDNTESGGAETSSPAPAPSGSSSVPPNEPPPTDDACSVANSAPEGEAKMVPEAPPAMTGGTIADGLWALTEVATYTGSGGASAPLGPVRETLRIRDQGKTFAVASTMNYPTDATVSGTLASSGSELVVKYTCGSGRPWEEYTATATTLKLAVTSNGFTSVATYTLME